MLTRQSNKAGKTSEGRSRKDGSPRIAVKPVTAAAAHRSCKTAFSKPVTLRAACVPLVRQHHQRIRDGGEYGAQKPESVDGLTPRVHVTTWDDYAIMSMVESGLGISILPELILRLFLE